MFNPSVFEKFKHKIKVKLQKAFSPIRRFFLNNRDFTIISNNCWGGICYESYGLPKNSPTIGGYFFAEDYLKFVTNLKYYTSLDIKMIPATESKHIEDLKKRNSMSVWVGVLDDIEFIALHYPDPKIAHDKWMRRIKRINWNNLIFKFSFQNNCIPEYLKQFDKLDLPGKKIMFVNSPNSSYKCGVYFPGYEEDDQLYNDTFYWDKYINVTKFINEKQNDNLHTGQ